MKNKINVFVSVFIFQKLTVQEKLVELYCNGTEQFGSIIQEILGKFAFQVKYIQIHQSTW